MMEQGHYKNFHLSNDMSLEDSTDTSHEYCPLDPEQQLSTSDMKAHPSR